MIFILNSSLMRMGVIKNVVSAEKTEELNGEFTLSFEAVLDSKLNSKINENTIYELDGAYFDTAQYTTVYNEDGSSTVNVEAEHVSYRLNDSKYNVETFFGEGSVDGIFQKILKDTDFTSGGSAGSDTEYAVNENTSRRQLLMDFVAAVGGELEFNGFEIRIVSHRGSPIAMPVVKDRNVKVISKSVNKRELDEAGNPKTAYTCQVLFLPGDKYSLGDEISFVHHDFGINERMRVSAISMNPYDGAETTVSFTNYPAGIDSGIYKIASTTVVKDKAYNGATLGPEKGFESVRGDNMARASFNSENLAIQTGDGEGGWTDKLYVETAENTPLLRTARALEEPAKSAKLVFEGLAIGEFLSKRGRGGISIVERSDGYFVGLNPDGGAEMAGMRLTEENGTELYDKNTETWMSLDKLTGGSGGSSGGHIIFDRELTQADIDAIAAESTDVEVLVYDPANPYVPKE